MLIIEFKLPDYHLVPIYYLDNQIYNSIIVFTFLHASSDKLFKFIYIQILKYKAAKLTTQ